jgi:hypothetical protein
MSHVASEVGRYRYRDVHVEEWKMGRAAAMAAQASPSPQRPKAVRASLNTRGQALQHGPGAFVPGLGALQPEREPHQKPKCLLQIQNFAPVYRHEGAPAVQAAAPRSVTSGHRDNLASPLKWLLNGSSRATPGLGKPLNEPDRDHDERTPGPRFSRVPQRRHRRPPAGPDIMATLRGPGTVASKRRPGRTAGNSTRGALKAINKGFGRA